MNKISIEDNQIEIRIVPSTEYILEGIINKVYVMFEFNINKKKSELEKRRTPLELSLVLDRSGSMSGKKIQNSKIAIEKIIQNLRNDDILHLVQYDDKIDVVFRNGNLSNKDDLISKVREIRARSMTNLSGGVIKGQELIDISKTNTKNKRIFLFSDGVANVGARSILDVSNIIKNIYSKGINVSSFGIGNDFSEDMMKAIAEHGSGDFFFIENADAIPNIIEEGMDGLLSIVTSNTKLKVRGKNGATVTKIFAYDTMEANLGDLRDGENRQVLVELEIKPGQKNIDEFLSYKLEYNPISNLMSKNMHEGRFELHCTSDESKIIDENEEVLVIRNLLLSSEMENEMMELIDEGRYKDAILRQEEIIKNLGKYRNVDKKGLINGKLKLSMKNLSKMREGKKKNDMKVSRKSIAYSSYQSQRSKKRRN